MRHPVRWRWRRYDQGGKSQLTFVVENYHLMTATITATRFMLLLLYFTFTFLPRCTTSFGELLCFFICYYAPSSCAPSNKQKRRAKQAHERSMSHEQAKAKSAANAKELFIWRWRVACAAHGVWFLTFMFWVYRYWSYRYR